MPRNKKRPLYLTDDMILAKWGEDVDFSCKIGHEAIRHYFGYSITHDLPHEEGVRKVPVSIAKDINAGRMRLMMEASDPPYRGLAYDSRGNCIRANGLTREEYEQRLREVVLPEPSEAYPVYEKNTNDSLKTGDHVIVLGHCAITHGSSRATPRIECMWPRDIDSAIKYLKEVDQDERVNWNSDMNIYIGNEFIVDRDIQGYAWSDGDGYLVCKLRDPETNDMISWQWHLGSLKKI